MKFFNLLLLVAFSTSIFSQNSTSTTTNTTINIMGTPIMDVNIEEHTKTEHTKNREQPHQNSNHATSKCSEMKSTSFNAAIASIQKQGFDETKLSSAKQIIKSNCMTVDQIKSICKLFGFEESKLDFAKYAYSQCLNKNDYFTINDIFSFSSSVEDLNAYLSEQK